jgi:hypothetical protein
VSRRGAGVLLRRREADEKPIDELDLLRDSRVMFLHERWRA